MSLIEIALHVEGPSVAIVACRDVFDRAGTTPPKPVEVMNMWEAESQKPGEAGVGKRERGSWLG